MATNTNEKVRISVEVLDNFIESKKNVEQWKKALAEAEKQGNKTQEEMREIVSELTRANKAFKSAEQSEIKSMNKLGLHHKHGQSPQKINNEKKRQKCLPFCFFLFFLRDPKQILLLKRDLLKELSQYR